MGLNKLLSLLADIEMKEDCYKEKIKPELMSEYVNIFQTSLTDQCFQEPKYSLGYELPDSSFVWCIGLPYISLDFQDKSQKVYLYDDGIEVGKQFYHFSQKSKIISELKRLI